MPPLIIRGPATKENWEKTWLTQKTKQQGKRLNKQASRWLAKSKKKNKKSQSVGNKKDKKPHSVWTISGGLPETNRRTH